MSPDEKPLPQIEHLHSLHEHFGIPDDRPEWMW
jgi:hypothetical protein